MAGRYRALLIGNSTYPADEHNLQALKGPVKDIAVLNRALVDRDTGLFADVDVTLLAETTATRTLRALSRFFGAANRDDVLLLYFSGHGLLDQRGRLYLCMQDTDTADVLSTAVSSTRVNEFAEASAAREMVIVLDCCYSGAFRGGELAAAVGGPGRYVLSSCRGTQLANDATVDNGTSLFTQHLVDGLLGAATDPDGDGYVGFSDVYSYVDRQLRVAGKQIPQRRVEGDGDVPLARRVPSVAGAPSPPDSPAAPSAGDHAQTTPAADVPPATRGSTPDRSTRDRSTPDRSTPDSSARGARRRAVLIAVAGAALAVGIGAALWAFVGRGGDGSTGSSAANTPAAAMTYTASAPWRLRIKDDIRGNDNGCVVNMTDPASGITAPVAEEVYGSRTVQIHQTGTLRLQANDAGCLLIPVPGSGTATVPFVSDAVGDTDAFTAPRRVSVQIKDANGNTTCKFRLFDAVTGQEIDVATAKSATDTVVLDPAGRRSVYLNTDSCAVGVSAA